MIGSAITEYVWAGVAVLIVVVLGLLIARSKIDGFKFKAGPVAGELSMHQLSQDVADLKVVADQINKAVNNVEINEPTLVQRVRYCETANVYQSQCLHKLAGHVGLVLPEPPQPI